MFANAPHTEVFLSQSGYCLQALRSRFSVDREAFSVSMVFIFSFVNFVVLVYTQLHAHFWCVSSELRTPTCGCSLCPHCPLCSPKQFFDLMHLYKMTAVHRRLLQLSSWWLRAEPPQVSVSSSLPTGPEIMTKVTNNTLTLSSSLCVCWFHFMLTGGSECTCLCTQRQEKNIPCPALSVTFFHILLSHALTEPGAWLNASKFKKPIYCLCSGATTETLTMLGFLCGC